MANEEAREAAVAAERAVFTNAPRAASAFIEAYLTGFGVGFDAGVAVGIRQAREAVEGVETYGAPDREISKRGALRAIDKLAAVDALGEQ